jgi:hypothetical protein
MDMGWAVLVGQIARAYGKEKDASHSAAESEKAAESDSHIEPASEKRMSVKHQKEKGETLCHT